MTKEQKQQLRELYPTHSNREIAKMTGWNYTEILNVSKNMGLKKDPSTKSRSAGKIIPTQEQLKFIEENYHKLNNSELAKALGFKITKTREFLYSLGFKRMDLEYWTQEQIDFLLENYSTVGDTELAEIFNSKWPKQKGWSKKHIEKKRRYLGLKRSSDQLKAIRQDWADKGLYAESVRKRWITTGSNPLGEIVWWNHHGRLIPHIKTDTGYVQYGRYRYQQLNGTIPEGFIVAFSDNDPMNISDKNLVLKTRSEMTMINSASQNLTNNYVIGMMTQGNPELRDALRSFPELIEIKRQQLLLQREINNEKDILDTRKNKKA